MPRPIEEATVSHMIGLVLALILLPAISLAFPNEPEGFEKARFGMSFVKVQQLYPDLEAVTPSGLSQEATPLVIETVRLNGRPVLGLSDCRVDFHFANSILFRVSFDCGRDKRVFDALRERFGVPNEESGGNLHWLSEARAVSVNPVNLKFTFTDRRLDREVLTAVLAFAKAPAPEPGAETGADPGVKPDAEGSALPPETVEPAAEGPISEELQSLDWFADEGKLNQAHRALQAAETPDDIVKLLLAVSSHMDERSAKVILPFLEHENEQIFDHAMLALEMIGGAGAVKGAGSQLGRPEVPKVRRLRALEALLELRAEDGAAQQIAKALTDPDVEIRQEATMNIVFTGDQTGVGARRAAHARETDEQTRRMQVRALELLGATPSPGGDEVAGEGASPEAIP